MESDNIGTPAVPIKNKVRSGRLQLIIVGVILAIVAISFGINVLSTGAPGGVPGIFAEMKLGSYVEGTQAMAQVNQLHGTQINLMDAFIAEYSHDFNPYHSDNTRVTVWVGTAGSNNAAAELLGRMVAGISRGSPAFTNLQRVTVDGYEIFQVKGSGGEHFFYQSRKSGDRVVWLIIQEAGNTMSLVEQALDDF